MTFEPLYQAAVQAFGSAPNAELEDRLIRAYEEHPIGVTRMLERSIEDAKNGTVYSWGVVAKRLEDLNRQPRPATATTQGRREAINAAEQWIRNAGLHFDRPDEIHHEVFDRYLRPWNEDPELPDRIHDLWHEHRPRALQVEADELDRAQRWVAANPKRVGSTAILDDLRITLPAVATQTHVRDDDIPF